MTVIVYLDNKQVLPFSFASQHRPELRQYFLFQIHLLCYDRDVDLYLFAIV